MVTREEIELANKFLAENGKIDVELTFVNKTEKVTVTEKIQIVSLLNNADLEEFVTIEFFENGYEIPNDDFWGYPGFNTITISRVDDEKVLRTLDNYIGSGSEETPKITIEFEV